MGEVVGGYHNQTAPALAKWLSLLVQTLNRAFEQFAKSACTISIYLAGSAEHNNINTTNFIVPYIYIQ